jgi:amino acid transporter
VSSPFPAREPHGPLARLRRELGVLESYAALVGILVGAGIFRVTSTAYESTGASVILGYLVLAPAVLATAVAYVVFLSTPLGREPGAEYAHVAAVFGAGRVAFLGAWLKLVSYAGACAYLSVAQADYLVELARTLGADLDAAAWRTPLALAGLVFFWATHALGVRWFGRLQVGMCAVLGLSIAVLVVPGLFAIRPEHYRPFFAHGRSGFLAALPPLFFAYAGFEALAHTAGEVRDSTRTLPRVFVRGIALTMVIFVSMSAVALGVLPAERVVANATPMAEAAAAYLPFGPTLLVTVGAVMAVATSLNASVFVPSRLMLVLVRDGCLPRWLGRVERGTGTPVVGLTVTLVGAAVLVLGDQIGLALDASVLALVLLYALHTLALLYLPRGNPALYAQVTSAIPRPWQRGAAMVSLVSMGILVASQLVPDARHVLATSLDERWNGRSFTSLELVSAWAAVGLVVHALRPGERRTESS